MCISQLVYMQYYVTMTREENTLITFKQATTVALLFLKREHFKTVRAYLL